MNELSKNAVRKTGRFLLAALLAAGMILTVPACTNHEGNSSTTTDTTVDRGAELPIVSGAASDYRIVYPADAVSSSRTVYNKLKNGIRMATECSLEMVKDGEEAVGHEILIGRNTRPASVEAHERLGDNQFSFSLSGESVVIAASDDDCAELAIQTFIENYIVDGKLSLYTGLLPITYQCDNEYKEVTIDNTKAADGDDPYVIRHNGNYYYCWSNNGVMVAKINNLNDITKKHGKNVFDRQKNGFDSVWAPELHYIDGNWYIYVAMCKGTSDNARHRMYCLKGTTQDPTDPFELVGQVTDSTDKWAIDGTVFQYKGELYTVWSGWPGNTDGRQNLYIAHMSNPWTIDSERVLISTPSGWDGVTQNPSVNEGPFPLVVGDTVHILYSGNGSWTDDYSIGYLTCKDGNLLEAKSWKKSRRALLAKSSQNYGPGHCSVTVADDGSYWMIYHANLESGTGWSGRSVRVQQINVTADLISVVRGSPLKATLPILKRKVVVGVVGEES